VGSTALSLSTMVRAGEDVGSGARGVALSANGVDSSPITSIPMIAAIAPKINETNPTME